MGKSRLNILPAPTYSWLGVNAAERDIQEYETSEPVEISGEGVQRIDITESGAYSLTADDGESAFAVLYYDSDTYTEVSVKADNNSTVKLVEIFDGEAPKISRLTADIAENANFDLVQLYIGGSDTVSEIVADLNGKRSRFTADIAYLLGGSDKLDINLLARHTGRKSLSQIGVKGVLDGDSRKVFKGTIDFKNGSEGAKGSENEDVLLMSDSAVNKTVPLILCAEEDVEGSHGASIGRVDEKQIFYMQSRGLPEEKIYELAARSKTAQVIKKIGDEETERHVNALLGRGDDDE